MTDFYLPRHDQQALLEQLRQVPALVEDLTIAITRQDRITARGPKTTRGDDTQPLPFNEHASDAAQFLYYAIAWWVRHTCEHRHIDYTGTDDVTSVARWLRSHIIDLALTPGSDASLPAIRDAVRNGNRACGGAKDRPIVEPSPHDLARARYSVLHASGIEKAAKDMVRNGIADYRHLTEQRVYRLARAGVITPDRTITLDGRETALYILGDVLDAHLKYPARQRKKVPA
ncbi:hypothetical protein CH304_00305 [Rhodococcus sp. 15-649-1-2]|nr:hypothetical protein [Rhodococcus sp. 15-649-1-2]OZE88046.1 hypothetical protein CH304_00305 [Rhodococcus sp. 15-649-1-2]